MYKDVKRVTAHHLTYALQNTRAGHDVVDLILTDDLTKCSIVFKSGYRKIVDIEADSGVAMIVDICRALM